MSGYLRPFAVLHIEGGLVATAIGLLVLGIGGPKWPALAGVLGFCAVGTAHMWMGYWELRIADEQD